MSDRRTTYAEQKTTRAARANAARMPSVPKERSRRNGDYSPPPAQIRTCSIPAYGSCLES